MKSRFLAFLTFATYSVLCLVPALALLFALVRLHSYWDDGAITASFARTFQQTGAIALTPVSEQVEGTSSLLWMLVLSAGSHFYRSADELLCWSKVASAIVFSSALFLFAKLARTFTSTAFALLAALILALTETPFVETLNGMEMNLYLSLVLGLTLALMSAHPQQSRSRDLLNWLVAAVISSALLLVRFEAPLTIFCLYIGVWLKFRLSKPIFILGFFNILVLSAVEVWRFHRFHAWVPNTILAKRWPPYSPTTFHDWISSRVDATAELLQVLLIPACVCGALWLVLALRRSSNKGDWKLSLDPILISMTLGALAVGLMLGKNWGHPGRMVLSFLPFLILALLFQIRHLCTSLRLDETRLIITIMLGQAVLWVYQIDTSLRTNPASYAAVEQTGLAADRVRVRLQRPVLSAFIPDVGGSSLCCENLRIMDSALLTNPLLAQRGYEAVPDYLRLNRPDLIETHGSWAADGGLYRSQILDGYGLVKVMNKYVFLREDLYDALKQKPGVHAAGSCLDLSDVETMRPKDAFFIEARIKKALGCLRVD